MVGAASKDARYLAGMPPDKMDLAVTSTLPAVAVEECSQVEEATMPIGDREGHLFDRGVSVGNFLVGLAAVFVTIALAVFGFAMSYASDKATNAERVSQYHEQTEKAVAQLREDVKSNATHTDSLKETVTAYHIDDREQQAKILQSLDDLRSQKGR